MTVLVATSAVAQEGNPGERLLERENRRQQFEELARNKAGQEISTPEYEGVVEEAVCFPIDKIHLTGNELYGSEAFTKLIAEFAGQCLGQQSINNLLGQITAVYADAGYITTRAYVPAQDIGNRELTIEVLEGKIEAYIYQQVDKDGNAKPGVPRKIKSAMPQKAGDVFQLRDLEHGLEQINRLRSSHASANLDAGEAPGTSRVAITEQKIDPIRGSIGIDSRGDEETGKTQISFNFEADDLLRINDTLFLSYSGSENTNALAFSFSAPYRKWLFSASGSYSESFNSIGLNTDLFSQTGNLNLRAEKLVFRDARSKYFVYGAAHGYWNERFVNIAALEPQLRTSMSLGFRQEHRLEKSIVAADVSLTFGAPFLGGDKDPSIPIAGAPEAEFTKLEGRLTYIRPFESGVQLTTSVSGQLASPPLFSDEQISVGGWETVRGYSGYSFSGDKGLYVRTELSFPAKELDFRKLGKSFEQGKVWNPFEKSQGGFRYFAFSDVGHVYAHATEESATMWSTGFGFSSQVGLSNLTGALAIPLVDANGQTGGDLQAFLGLRVKVF